MIRSFLGGPSADLSRHVFLLGRTDAGVVTIVGTAFAVSATQVATALHVVEDNDRNLVLILPKVTSTLDYQDTADTGIRAVPVVVSATDPVRGLCVITLNDLTIKNPPRLGSIDEVTPGTPVVALGFPHESPFRMVFSHQHARVGARVLVDHRGEKTRQVLLDIPERVGQCGGPVLNASMNAVVAVVLGDDPTTAGAAAPRAMRAISAEYLTDLL